MRVIICGAGRVGYGICARLAGEKFDVTVIDQSEDLIRHITERLEVRGIVGNASYPDVLTEAGAAETDLIIAVTQSDEVNIVSCQIAHSLFNVPTKMARIRGESYLDNKYADLFSRNNIPIDVVISPESEVAEAILQRLATPSAFEIRSFADGRIWAVGLKIKESCPITDTPLRQVAELFPDLEITIVGVARDGKIFRPHADDELTKGDDIYFVADRNKVDRALQILSEATTQARKIIIVGGGNIGYHVAKALDDNNLTKIRIIEPSSDRAHYIAEHLERAVVIQGSGLDRDILLEAGAADCETIVAVSNSDEVNVLSSIIAKREGTNRALCLVNERTYGEISESVGIDRFVDPRAVTVSTILQHVRRGRIKGVFSIMDGAAELVDAIALETSSLVGETLKDTNLPSGVVVGAILRDGEVILPTAKTIIQANDRVVLMALRENVKDVEQMFRVTLEYF